MQLQGGRILKRDKV